jgi:YHS domain-containing protein
MSCARRFEMMAARTFIPNFTTNMKRFILFSLFITVALHGFAQSGEVFTTDNGAINGYDPVAYFKENKPVIGMKEISYSWRGASWYFSTEDNLKLFQTDPDKYVPQYGGYCAYGTAEGHKAPTQPDAWTITNNKLYFNYNKDVQKLWQKDQATFIQKADKNWPTVKLE